MVSGLVNSALGGIQRATHGARIAELQLAQPPLFILGHWRSGTTLLHELLALDERHRAPTSLECFAPTHCLVSGRYLKKLKFLLPDKRPMDDMAFGWQRPQEDEFALMNMGLPSVYRQIAFPNNPPIDLETLDFDGVPAAERARWQEGLRRFVKTVALRNPKKRIVLKSPQHLGRVGVLLEAFPDARFVHIVRDPHAVFPSTVKLWKALFEIHALQTPRFEGLEERVLSSFERLYAGFERDRNLIAPGRLHELRYEDLVADPLTELRKLYDGLGLGGFDRVRPGVEAYLRDTANYRTNVFEPDACNSRQDRPPLGPLHAALRLLQGRRGRHAGAAADGERASAPRGEGGSAVKAFIPPRPQPRKRRLSMIGELFSSRRSWFSVLTRRHYRSFSGEQWTPARELYFVNDPDVVSRILSKDAEHFPEERADGDDAVAAARQRHLRLQRRGVAQAAAHDGAGLRAGAHRGRLHADARRHRGDGRKAARRAATATYRPSTRR